VKQLSRSSASTLPFQVGVVRVVLSSEAASEGAEFTPEDGAGGGRPGECWSVKTKDFLLPSFPCFA